PSKGRSDFGSFLRVSDPTPAPPNSGARPSMHLEFPGRTFGPESCRTTGLAPGVPSWQGRLATPGRRTPGPPIRTAYRAGACAGMRPTGRDSQRFGRVRCRSPSGGMRPRPRGLGPGRPIGPTLEPATWLRDLDALACRGPG